MATRRRRIRYRAQVERAGRHDEIDVLAYSEAQAWRVASANGYRVFTMIPTRALAPAQRYRRRSWHFDKAAIRDALDAMSIDLPNGLTFESTWRGTRARGRLRIYPDGRAVIQVAAWCTPEQASATTWHELAHAAQYAREGGTWAGWLRMKQRDHGIGYRDKSMEREAREWEALAETDPLVRAVG